MLKAGKKIIQRMLGRKERINLFSNLNANEYRPKNANPIFVTGPGRSGTHFVARLFEILPEVKAYHLDDVGDSVGDSFELFSQWNNLNIRNDGFLNSRGFLIEQAQSLQKRFLESNPLVAFSLIDLHKEFDGKIIITIRHPRKVVESHFRKGWYLKVSESTDGLSGYQYFHDRPNHFFSRVVPRDPNAKQEWLRYTQLGKISWMWRITYEQIFMQLKTLPPSSFKIVQLESLNHQSLDSLCTFLGLTNSITTQQFDELRKTPPGKGDDRQVEWDRKSKEIFNNEIRKVVGFMPADIKVDDWFFKD